MGIPVIYQQPRPGPKLPKGESYLTIGWKQVHNRQFFLVSHLILNQIWVTSKQYKKLPYTFTYLIAFFLLADVRRIPSVYDNLDLRRLCLGFEHNWNAGDHLSE
jgi:hypothetical protein